MKQGIPLDTLKWEDITKEEREFLFNYDVAVKGEEEGWKLTSLIANGFEMVEDPVVGLYSFFIRENESQLQMSAVVVIQIPGGENVGPYEVADKKELLKEIMEHHPHKDIYRRKQIMKLKDNIEKALSTKVPDNNKPFKI